MIKEETYRDDIDEQEKWPSNSESDEGLEGNRGEMFDWLFGGNVVRSPDDDSPNIPNTSHSEEYIGNEKSSNKDSPRTQDLKTETESESKSNVGHKADEYDWFNWLFSGYDDNNAPLAIQTSSPTEGYSTPVRSNSGTALGLDQHLI